ncbi:MAG: hypothetical protein E2O36_04855 [Proteobacteria bacterium]|nr:MAG: hypothetical protein E2O36_04855 [Pseudomonadota bacterium]
MSLTASTIGSMRSAAIVESLRVNRKECRFLRILAVTGALLGGVMLMVAGAGGAMWYARHGGFPGVSSSVATTEPVSTSEQVSSKSGAKEIELAMLRQLLALVAAKRRDTILASSDVFAKFVQQERSNQAVLTAAYANAADQSESVGTLMLRASQKVLAEAYLTQVVRRNLDPKFPSDVQTSEFYTSNKASFRLPDRVHLWQIFIPADNKGSEREITDAASLASQVAKALHDGKGDFASAAVKHSKHVQSRLNDGYMGLLKMDALLPEVRAAVAKLKPDAVSAPLQSDAGFHIVRRGALVRGTQLDYATVRPRIEAKMRLEAERRVRQAALKKILDTYPVAVDESALENWRRQLQTVESSTMAAAIATPGG